MRGIALAFTLVLGGACAAERDETETPPGGQPNTTSERDQPRPPTSPASSPSRRPAVYDIALSRTTVDRAEDGAGNTVTATAPVAIDVRADSWPGRALDPVLHVGQLHLHEYSFADKHTIRYVVADSAVLTAGSEVAVQYGDDASSRAIVTTSLEVVR